jgi:hypothetical protein
MNLYLVIAIALGAITGVVEAPVVRPVQVVRRDVRAEKRVIRRVASFLSPRSLVLGFTQPRPEARGPRPFTIASPRAPAFA